jgi:hypothetical protein
MWHKDWFAFGPDGGAKTPKRSKYIGYAKMQWGRRNTTETERHSRDAKNEE